MVMFKLGHFMPDAPHLLADTVGTGPPRLLNLVAVVLPLDAVGRQLWQQLWLALVQLRLVEVQGTPRLSPCESRELLLTARSLSRHRGMTAVGQGQDLQRMVVSKAAMDNSLLDAVLLDMRQRSTDQAASLD